jgi:hypothetical protein
MDTTSSSHSNAAAARRLSWQRALAVTLLAAGLSGAPALARSAAAQRPAAIQASAFVTSSYMATGLRANSETVTAAAARRLAPPASRQVRIAGFGFLDVRSGPDTLIRVTSAVAEARDASGPTIRVSISYLGN